jgi:acetylornithine deacetylase/succinyl-diaminopimelate desuccinylase-like protein
MDTEALRAHPAASPFDWDVRDKVNVVATWEPSHRNGGLSLILNGHIDVVSPEPRSQWDRDPFTAHVEADWLYGRGAADMKCGLAAILGAVKGLRELGLAPHAPVIVQSVVEEECTGNGALQTLLAGYRADAAIIAEPFGAAITTSQVGVLWFDVVIEGLPGHAAEAGHAVNAIAASLMMIAALRVLEAELNASPPPPYDSYPHPISLNVGQIHAGDWNSTVPGDASWLSVRGVPGYVDAGTAYARRSGGRRRAAAQPRVFPTLPVSSIEGSRQRARVRRTIICSSMRCRRPTPGTWVVPGARRDDRHDRRPRLRHVGGSRRCASVRTRRPPMGSASGCTFRAWCKRRR